MNEKLIAKTILITITFSILGLVAAAIGVLETIVVAILSLVLTAALIYSIFTLTK
jgi:hypothetical protein